MILLSSQSHEFGASISLLLVGILRLRESKTHPLVTHLGSSKAELKHRLSYTVLLGSRHLARVYHILDAYMCLHE